MAIESLFPDNAVSLRTVDGTLTYDLAFRDTHTVDIDPKFHSLDEVAQGSRLLALLTKLGSPTVAKAPIFFMLRKKQLPRFVNLSTSYVAADATVDVAAADVAKFKSGYHLMNTLTREVMRVNGTPAAAMPVERSIGEVAAADSVSTDDELLLLYYRGAAGDVKFLDFILFLSSAYDV